MGGDGIMEIQLGFNTTTPPGEKYQVGGTLNTTFDEMAFRVRKRGEDARGLGRWSWQELQGINDLKTTIVTPYCPVVSSNPGGCYSQHLRYMAQHANDENGSEHAVPEAITCPRALFGHDLQRFLEGRIDQGHQIVLMGDFNSEYADLREWMLDLGLLDIIGEKTWLRQSTKDLQPFQTIPNRLYLHIGQHRGIE